MQQHWLDGHPSQHSIRGWHPRLEQYHFSEVNKLVILDKMIKKEEGIQMRVYDKEFKEEALKLS
ncbi:hypothetical protein, partial [Ferroacidibacillus organovorans]|uniref:hypothetical protein n=1 Tax=Ferroacidibacillus organovorans TaxID=1765683 RepID=UPI001F3374B7